jgi:hypothetical protein
MIVPTTKEVAWYFKLKSSVLTSQNEGSPLGAMSSVICEGL